MPSYTSQILCMHACAAPTNTYSCGGHIIPKPLLGASREPCSYSFSAARHIPLKTRKSTDLANFAATRASLHEDRSALSSATCTARRSSWCFSLPLWRLSIAPAVQLLQIRPTHELFIAPLIALQQCSKTVFYNHRRVL